MLRRSTFIEFDLLVHGGALRASLTLLTGSPPSSQPFIDMSDVINTRVATITLSGLNLLEVRFKKGIKVDSVGLHEVLQQRSGLVEKGPFLVLGILPADIDFDINVMTDNHYADHKVLDHTLAVA